MELLSRTLVLLRRLFTGPGKLYSYGLLMALAAIEIIGRKIALSDLYDLVGVAILAAIVLRTLARHRQTSIPWVEFFAGMGQWLNHVVRGLAIDIGIDLRGDPPLPRGVPGTIPALLAFLTAPIAFLVVFSGSIPQDVRPYAIQICYVGYLVLLAALWLALTFGTLLAILIPAALIHDVLVSRHMGPGRRSLRVEGTVLCCYFGTILLAAMLLPPWTPLAVCGVAFLANLATIALPSNPDVKFLWRYRWPGSPIWAMPWGWFVACEFALVSLVIVDFSLLACGSSLLRKGDMPLPVAAAEPGAKKLADKANPHPVESMPVTTTLGLLLAWLGPGTLTALVVQTILGRLRDPARHCRPIMHVTAFGLRENRRHLKDMLQSWGWSVRFAPAPEDALDVCVELTDERSSLSEENVRWPLPVREQDLFSGRIQQQLARRDEIQKRRRLTSGLERLFKFAARRNDRGGSGYWIAPHYWFITGLTRDTQEEELDLGDGTILSGIIGPPYHRVLPRGVRHHIYQILRALQVDLIFVEDGVGFRRFCRVLRMMFEVYDVYGGRRRADEIHFHGVPRVRVMIHEFVLDEPFKSEIYPEPNYEHLGRARILHIFRDRGEQEEPLETPLDFTRMPAPSLMR